MPAYAFEALDAEGATQKGVIEADTAKAARGLLRTRALVPLDVKPVAAGDGGAISAGRALFTRPVFSPTSLAIWTRQLAGLVTSGLTLERALTALADDLEERQSLNAKLMAATLYPAIVTVAAISIVLLLMTYVVPQVANVFAGTKHALPLLTVVMLAFSGFLRAWGIVLLFALAMGFAALRYALRAPAFRERFDAGWLKLPLLGRLSRQYNAARFAGTLAMLSGAGVPILKSLQAAAETLGNRSMRADALDALVLVREGAPLAAALAQKKRFPGLLAMFARMGEQTGQLPQMLDRAAKQLSTEVQRRALQMATLLEPLLIVGMGMVVMLIVLAVLLPIIQLNQWVK